MKKFFITFGVLAVLVIGGFTLLQQYIMGGTPYYVQITTAGEKVEEKDDAGRTVITYRYELTGYDEQGTGKELTFDSFEPRPLKKEAYLKVIWNERKGVTSWEEVQKSEVPTKAMTKLSQKG